MSSPKFFKEPHTICIIQITRMGDIVQTIQAAECLKREYPDVKLIFIGRKTFASPLEDQVKLIFSKIFYIDLLHLFDSNQVKCLDDARGKLKGIINLLEKEKITVNINLSFSNSSSYLNTLIPAKFKIGIYKNNFDQLVVKDKWSQFVYSNVMAGHYSPFNLVDIYRWIMGTKLTPINSSPDSSKKEKKIIFHPFSSNTKKSWGHSKWSELLYNFLKTFSDYDVILVGSPSEQSMAKKILEHQILNNYSSKILNLVGKSTIKQLFQEIKNAQLFVGHDSMCGHIASYVGTRSITISLGTVRPQETTPYGSGNINIVPKTACFPCFPTDKCDNYLCHKDISINKTIKVIADCLQGHEIIDDSDPIINTSRIFTTKIKEDFGQLCLPMTEVNTVNDLFKSYYMILWSYLLNEKEVNLKIPNLLKIDLDAVSFYQEGIEHLFELVSFAVTFSGQILKEAENKMPNVEKIQSYANKLVEVDQLANLLKGPYPELTPLINYFEVAKANVEGESILEVAQNTFVTNHSYKNSIQILFELMEKTMSSYNISKAESAASHS